MSNTSKAQVSNDIAKLCKKASQQFWNNLIYWWISEDILLKANALQMLKVKRFMNR